MSPRIKLIKLEKSQEEKEKEERIMGFRSMEANIKVSFRTDNDLYHKKNPNFKRRSKGILFNGKRSSKIGV